MSTLLSIPGSDQDVILHNTAQKMKLQMPKHTIGLRKYLTTSVSRLYFTDYSLFQKQRNKEIMKNAIDFYHSINFYFILQFYACIIAVLLLSDSKISRGHKIGPIGSRDLIFFLMSQMNRRLDSNNLFYHFIP